MEASPSHNVCDWAGPRTAVTHYTGVFSYMHGFFITLEGIDGTGKSTQARLLVDALKRQGLDVVHTREPGGTELGRRLRELLLHGIEYHISPMAEMLLLAADRAQHVDEVIRPALSRGAVVVSERYVDSSLAYQSAAGVSFDDVRQVNKTATGDLTPDVTFLFDLDPDAAFHRDPSDRIEERSLAYHRRVSEIFRALAAQESERVVRLPVQGRNPEEIHAIVLTEVRKRMSERMKPAQQ